MYLGEESTRFLVDGCKHPKADKTFLASGLPSVEDWAKQTRPWVLEKFCCQPEKGPVQWTLLDEEDFGAYIRKHILYMAAEGCPVPAYLLIPKDLKKPAPGILALHCHSGRYFYGKEKIVDHHDAPPTVQWFQNFRYGGRGYASRLAQMGYVVLCPDAIAFGERRFLDVSWLGVNRQDLLGYKEGTDEYVFAFDEMWAGCEPRLMDAIAFSGATLPGLLYRDDDKGVDLLCSLPEVDQNRLGCVGLSMGGYRAAFLGALDTRIRCTCIAGYLTRFQDITPRRCPVGWGVPGLYNALPYPALVSLSAPRSLLVLNCENDSLFELSTVTKAVEEVRGVYRSAGAEEAFTDKGFPVGHQFGLAMQETAFDWFRKNL